MMAIMLEGTRHNSLLTMWHVKAIKNVPPTPIGYAADTAAVSFILLLLYLFNSASFCAIFFNTRFSSLLPTFYVYFVGIEMLVSEYRIFGRCSRYIHVFFVCAVTQLIHDWTEHEIWLYWWQCCCRIVDLWVAGVWRRMCFRAKNHQFIFFCVSLWCGSVFSVHLPSCFWIFQFIHEINNAIGWMSGELLFAFILGLGDK